MLADRHCSTCLSALRNGLPLCPSIQARDHEGMTQGPGGLAMGAFHLTQMDVEDFRTILREECGEELSTAQAHARCIEMLDLFKMLAAQAARQELGNGFEHRPT